MKNSQSAIAMLIAASATLAACQANGNRPPTSTVLEVGAGSIGSSSSANSHDRTIEELVDPTAPSISRKGPALQVTAKGLAYAIDLQSLLDADHGFQPVGRNPDLDHDALVLETTVSGLFSMGYFDQMGTLSQTQVDEGLNGVRLTKPIRKEMHPCA